MTPEEAREKLADLARQHEAKLRRWRATLQGALSGPRFRGEARLWQQELGRTEEVLNVLQIIRRGRSVPDAVNTLARVEQLLEEIAAEEQRLSPRLAERRRPGLPAVTLEDFTEPQQRRAGGRVGDLF